MKKFLVVCCLFAMVTVAFADNSKLSPDLLKCSAPTARVIVQYKSPPALLDLQGITNLLGSIVSQLPLINAVVADLSLTDILSLSNQSNVRYISLDRTLAPTLSNAGPAVKAYAAWQSGYTGSQAPRAQNIRTPFKA